MGRETRSPRATSGFLFYHGRKGQADKLEALVHVPLSISLNPYESNKRLIMDYLITTNNHHARAGITERHRADLSLLLLHWERCWSVAMEAAEVIIVNILVGFPVGIIAGVLVGIIAGLPA